MNCRQVRANLVNYLAKEYCLFDLAEMEDHLASCSSCQAELFSLEELDLTLSVLPGETAPLDFAAGVTGRIRNYKTDTRTTLKQRSAVRLIFYRDLVAAAAVTLVLFLSGGNLFDYQNYSRAAHKMNTVVQICLKTSGAVVNQAYDTAGSINPQNLLKELNQNEVRTSR